jgi:gliding motility-associated-like protein
MPAVRLHNDYFGYSVALYGDEIVVGAPGYPTPGYLSEDYMQGTAYIFRKPNDGWTGVVHEAAQLLPSNAQRLGTFGYAVAIEQDDIFVGAPHNYFFYNVVDNFNNDDDHLKPGAVYHYIRKDDWVTTSQEDRRIESLQPEWSDAFGASVKFHDRLLFVGSPLDDTDAGLKTGSVQVFMQTPVIRSIETPCVEDGLVKAIAYPDGGLWDIDGMPEQASNEFRLNPGTYTLTYSLNGCSDTKSFTVISSGLDIGNTNANQLTCINQELYLESNADDARYIWYFKENENDNYEVIETDKKRIVGNDPGFYLAEISHDYCASHKEHFIVTAPVDIALEPQPVICLDDAVQLRGYPTDGTWSGTGISSSGLLKPENLPNGTHTFQYSVVSESGCHFSKDLAVTIHKLIKPEIIASSHSLCFNDPVTLRVDNQLNQGSVTWHLLNEEQHVGSGEQITVSQVGHYEAEVAKNGCVVRTEPFVVEPKQDSLFVPNIIIPNGDPFNEYFEIRGEGLNEFDVQVFNRYGELVYQSSDPEFKWTALNVSSGIYYWNIRYSDCERKRKTFKGYVQLVRDH